MGVVFDMAEFEPEMAPTATLITLTETCRREHLRRFCHCSPAVSTSCCGARPVTAAPSFEPRRITTINLLFPCITIINYPRNHSSSLLYGCLGPSKDVGAGATGAKLFGVGLPESCQKAMILHPVYMCFSGSGACQKFTEKLC